MECGERLMENTVAIREIEIPTPRLTEAKLDI